MIARRSVWSDPRVRELMPRFIPVADEVHRLQSRDDPECRLFQVVAEQGHYAGRTRPSGTRQGTYAAAPSGRLLASMNSNDPERIAAMLRQALDQWEALPRAERLLAADPAASTAELRRAERLYPEDGLVLRVYSRDLPREQPLSDWRASAWNTDMAWFTRAEARLFVPESPAVGAKREVPDVLVRRIARCHLVDNVRGQTSPFGEPEVEKALLTTEVTGLTGDVVTLRLEGETRAAAEGIWSINGFRDIDAPTPQQRGMATRLLGNAAYDLRRERFTAFELLALGTRWGATQYNVRGDDREAAPIGFSLSLAGTHPADRVAPAHLRAYGWL